MCLVLELPGRQAGFQPVLRLSFPKHRREPRWLWVSRVTQGQGLPHQAQALPVKLSFLLSFAPGGAIHTDYNENEPPHPNTCIQLCNEVLLQPPRLWPASPVLLDKHPQALTPLIPR